MHFAEKKVADYFVDVVLRDPDKSITVCGAVSYTHLTLPTNREV